MDTTSLRQSLLDLARNHDWAWSSSRRITLDALPGAGSERHPATVVAALTEDQLVGLLADGELMVAVRDQCEALSAVVDSRPDRPEVAYFSPEFGIAGAVPQYSGGLGILAGDHLKAASDLRVSLIGVGLFYRHGYFSQSLADDAQAEDYETYSPVELGCVDTGVSVTVPLAGRDLEAQVWTLDVGAVQLVLLDTCVDANSSADQQITDRLYGGDRRHRIEQELVLGVGGARALRALDRSPRMYHLNEGHAGFLLLDLLDAHIGAGASLSEALAAIRPQLAFTTHTPVAAGIDRFPRDMIDDYLARWSDSWGVPLNDILDLGTDPHDLEPTFNMAAFCLKASARANGVSKLHGEVSRELFAHIPGGSEIGSVTNGVHARTWVSEPLQDSFDQTIGPGWADGDPDAWARVDGFDDDTIRSQRRDGRARLSEVLDTREGISIDPDALTVGFARRFATYKRASLLLRQRDLLVALLADDSRPIQFVFAGKAHPADGPGKALLAEIVAFSRTPEANGRFIFLPGYDIGVAKAMYAGCDVWLNTPVRGREASGTSGEKSALNGGLNCSISDGWWDEMADGTNGWTIGASDETDPEARDSAESAAVLALLSDHIVAEFYDGGVAMSAMWIDRVRHMWRTLGPQVTAARMVADYRDQVYQPALDALAHR